MKTRCSTADAGCRSYRWPVASGRRDACPGQSCPFWRDVCEHGGSFSQTNVGRCVQEDGNTVVLWSGVCTSPNHAPWTVSCTGL